MKTIYLIGFMGSGKSTIAAELAKSLSTSYIDTDDYIENKHEVKIADIFNVSGEKVFRRYEILALKEVSSYDVVSTGGGIVENEENFNTMNDTGVIVYLKTSFEEISRRLENDTNRPLWDNNINEKITLYERRIPLYEKHADYVVVTDHKVVEDIVKEIIDAIKGV